MTHPDLTDSSLPMPAPVRRGAQGGWRPCSTLSAVERAFAALTSSGDYWLDGSVMPGLPDERIDLSRLRHLLLSQDMTPATRDAVWRELVRRSRRPASEGQTWTLLATGIALPGLIAAAGRLSRGVRGETGDIDAEVVAGFIARLRTLDLGERRVVGRLIDAAVRAGRRSRASTEADDRVRVDSAWSRPAGPWDHPDWVLARAVAVGVVDRTEARLIGATRLEHVPLAQAAAALRIDPELASAWRRRAEARVRDAVHNGELEASVALAPARRPRRPREQRLVMAGARSSCRRPVAS